MFPIVGKQALTDITQLFVIQAPDIARKAQPGQFVIVRLDEKGERVPLTIADFDRRAGTISIVVQEVGASTKEICALNVGESIQDVVGPLGNPTHIEKYGTVICVGGGFGVAPTYPITRALKEAGNYIITIFGARTRDLLFWEDRMRSVSDELIVTTDDGSYGRQGVVTGPLKEILDSGRKVDLVLAIGPSIMMKFVSLTTQPYGIKTIVSLNSIMVDGTGMCGACRVEVGGKTRFACVDGIDFDGHQVNWDLLMERQRIYLEEEKRALEYHDGRSKVD